MTIWGTDTNILKKKGISNFVADNSLQITEKQEALKMSGMWFHTSKKATEAAPTYFCPKSSVFL